MTTWLTGAVHEHVRHRIHRWPGYVVISTCIIIYLTLPERLTFGPTWLLPVLELFVLVPMVIIELGNPHHARSILHRLTATMIGLMNLANLCSLALLVYFILHHDPDADYDLIFGAAKVWATNALGFALLYWSLDGGGPTARHIEADDHRLAERRDFVFPEMTLDHFVPPGWSPGFLDYLYTSFSNATSFGPGDAMPVTRLAKTLLLVEALASLVTIAVLVGHAIAKFG